MEDAAYCFVAGTNVLTPSGPAAIETLVSGSQVYSWDVDKQRLVLSEVQKLTQKNAAEILEVRFEGRPPVRVTPEHPFYEPSRKDYVKIGELRSGDAVLFYDPIDQTGRPLKIDHIKKIQGSFETFNLSVGGEDKNFFADGILVHNKLDCSPGQNGC